MKHFSDSIAAFGNLMTQVMGFSQYVREPVGEVCWRTTIPGTIFTIHVRSGMTADSTFTPAPDIGIRIYLMDSIQDASVLPMIRVRRTPHSLRNVRLQVGILWKYVVKHRDRSGSKLLVKG